jgi:hypothetical protein
MTWKFIFMKSGYKLRNTHIHRLDDTVALTFLIKKEMHYKNILKFFVTKLVIILTPS